MSRRSAPPSDGRVAPVPPTTNRLEHLTHTASNRSALTFVVLTYTLTWACWFPMALRPHDLQALHYVGSLGPLAAAFILVFARDGTPGIRRLWAAMVRWRGCARWLALAVTLPVVLYAVGVVGSELVGEQVALGNFFGSKEYPHLGLILIPIEIIFFGFGEESGWRGFLIPQLEGAGRTPYHASTILIGVWAGWHLPLFFYAYGLSSLSLLMVPGWLISIALSTYLLTWLFHRARDSILVVAVFHGVVDLVSITPASTAVVLITVNAGLIAAAVLVLTKSRLLYELRPAHE